MYVWCMLREVFLLCEKSCPVPGNSWERAYLFLVKKRKMLLVVRMSYMYSSNPFNNWPDIWKVQGLLNKFRICQQSTEQMERIVKKFLCNYFRIENRNSSDILDLNTVVHWGNVWYTMLFVLKFCPTNFFESFAECHFHFMCMYINLHQ